MDYAKQHWQILKGLGIDLANRVRSFMVIGMKGDGVIVATEDGQGFWLGEMEFGWGEKRTATEPTPLDIPDLVHMAQGKDHIFLLNKLGEIYSMGWNYSGQLGLSHVDEVTPFSPQLISIPHKFISIRCSDGHSLALTEDGKVWAWGGIEFRKVGVSSLTEFLQSPRQISELDTHRVVEVECGAHHSLALTDQGEVYAWSVNVWGQLCDGSKPSYHTPTRIPSPSPVQSMAAGQDYTLLLTQTGEVWACGWNRSGQLGLPTTTKSSASLVKVAGLPPITQIASHPRTNLSIAMSSDQQCFIWGELRDGIDFSTPRKLPPVYSTVESPLSYYSYYRNTPHSVTMRKIPQSLSTKMFGMFDNPETSDVQFVVEQRTIHAHRIILSNSSDYFARMFSKRWLGPVDPENPVFKVAITKYSYQAFYTFLRFFYTNCLEVHSDLLPELFELATQYFIPELQQLCLSRMRSTLTLSTCCLYYPLTHRHSQLLELATFQQELVQFASTQMSEVVHTANYQLMEPDLCVKLINAVQNFLSTEMDNAKQHWQILKNLKTELTNRVQSFLVIGESGKGVIVTTEDGQGFWFGKMQFGMGKPRTANEPTPLDVPELVEMTQGYSHILLLNKRGEIYSMGMNDYGQLGLGHVDEVTHFSPQLISIPHKFISIRCSDWHSLALTEDGKVWVWGLNNFGQVGVDNSTENPLPSPRQIPELDPHRVVAVECGGAHSLALTDLGEVYAWGCNGYGQLGYEGESSTHIPTQISTPSPVQSMAAGCWHTLLLTKTGEVWACGGNENGQLGLPTATVSSPRLSKVVGLPYISQIASHPATNLSVAMSFSQRCFIWGDLRNEKFISTPRELPQFYSTVESPFSSFSFYPNTSHSVTIPKTPRNRLSVGISRMFDNPETSDVQFVVEQRTIHAHRNILSNSSDYFARMFSERWLTPVDPKNPIVKVTISDHSYQVFHALLRFLYTDSLEVYFDLLPELFELANLYLVQDLQQKCLLRMRTNLSLATCCLYYPLTHRHSLLPELATFQQELVQFASTRMSEVVHSPAYKLMEPDLRQDLTNAAKKFLSSWQTQTKVDKARIHWLILQGLENDLANRVREFMVTGEDGDGVIVATKDGQGFWLGKMQFGYYESRTATEPTLLDISGLVHMAQGDGYILLLNQCGQIYAMGINYKGQLGLGHVDYETHYSPQLISSPHKFISVRCGNSHSLALTDDGKVWAWGRNCYGQVDVPSSIDPISSPRQISELDPHQVVAVECGGEHSLALTDQGEVYAWGLNLYGQLGNGSKLSTHTLTRIPIFTPVQSMAAGLHHNLLLTQTGEVYACGDNSWGQLGFPTTTLSSGSLSKVAGLPPISQIASHPRTSLSIAMSFSQRCFVWGRLHDGRSISTPRELPPIYSTVESPLSFYSTHGSTPYSVTIPDSSRNQLSVRFSPKFNNAEISDVQFVVEQSTIHAHRNILSNSSDYFAQMFSERRLAPVDPKDPIVKVFISEFSYKTFHAFLRFLYNDCLEIQFDLLPELFELATQYFIPELQQICISRMRTNLSLATCCLYYPLTHRHSLPSELATLQQELVQFASTRMSEVVHSDACQLMESDLRKNLINATKNVMSSWQTQFEIDNSGIHWLILQGLGKDLANRVREFMVTGADGDRVIVATKDGQGFWLSKMPFGNDESRTATEPTLLDISGLVHMAQGSRHILLLNQCGQIYAMGRNNYGQLGLGHVDEETHYSPQLISSPHKFISVRCGNLHSLALTDDGKVWAWGENETGQAGVPSSIAPISSPRQISELDPHRVVAVECGGEHSLALTDQGEVYVWGWNLFGQLGNGSNLFTHSPTRISISTPVKSMAAGYSHTLLLTQTGEVYACGRNKFGQLGLPITTKSSYSLSKVAGLPPISQIASHPYISLSIAMSHKQRCFIWGELRNEKFISTPLELPPVYSTVESPLSFYSRHRSTPHSVTIPDSPKSVCQNVPDV